MTGALGAAGSDREVTHSDTLLAVRHVTKSFGSTTALRSVDLEMHPGEVVGLVGHNGSGKSTLVGVLAGQHRPDIGAEATLRGAPVAFPLDRAEVGIGVVTQDLGLLDNLTVLENFTISRHIRPRGGSRVRIDWRSERRDTERKLQGYGVELDVDRRVGDLTLLQKALLAIVRCAEDLESFGRTPEEPGIIVLDEATVFLPEREQQFLFRLIRENAGRGTAVLVVSHSIAVIRELAERVVVLRDGRVVLTSRMADVADTDLVAVISGHTVGRSGAVAAPRSRRDAPPRRTAEEPADQPPQAARPERTVGGVVFEVRGLSGGRVSNLDLHARAGEIVGVAGLVGSGAEDLPYLLFGSTRARSGVVGVRSRRLAAHQLTPVTSIEMGLGLVPANRRDEGLVNALATWENMLLLVNSQFWRGGIMRMDQARKRAAVECEEFHVLPSDPRAVVAALSGGNQQKVLLAKWFQIEPTVLLLHEPTQGVDVGARATIHDIVRRMAAAGTAIVWFSNDFGEMATIADRVLVIAHGEMVRELSGPVIAPGDIAAAAFEARSDREEGRNG